MKKTQDKPFAWDIVNFCLIIAFFGLIQLQLYNAEKKFNKNLDYIKDNSDITVHLIHEVYNHTHRYFDGSMREGKWE